MKGSVLKTLIETCWLNIDKKSYKNIDIYHIFYIPIKNISDYENIHSVNLLYLIIGEVDVYLKNNEGYLNDT